MTSRVGQRAAGWPCGCSQAESKERAPPEQIEFSIIILILILIIVLLVIIIIIIIVIIAVIVVIIVV